MLANVSSACEESGSKEASGGSGGSNSSDARDADEGSKAPDGDADAGEPPPTDPGCAALKQGDNWPTSACVGGAICKGTYFYHCPDGYVALGMPWSCQCPSGTWLCKNDSGGLTFPDCSEHQIDGGQDAASEAPLQD
jgi:hypothetical protein